MQLISICVKNFRCLQDVEIPLHKLTVLIGENDSGKSSILDLLDIILNEKQPDQSDYYFFDDGSVSSLFKASEIEAVLTFKPYTKQVIPIEKISTDGLFILKKRFTVETNETWYYGRKFDNENLNRDLSSLRVSDLDEIIRELGIPAEAKSVKEQKINRIEEYKNNAPFHYDWIAEPQSKFKDFLPRFEQYKSTDYQDPVNIVMKTLRTIYENKIFEIDDQGNRKEIAPLSELKSIIENELNLKISELREYVQRYNPKVQKLEFLPTIDFSSGLKSGSFTVDDGRGLHLLSKCGEGTKKRLFMAFFDWDKEVLRQQQTRPIVRGYDEPDANLHYEAQRRIFQSIQDIVNNDNSQIQALVCTHSLTMIDHAPTKSINLLKMSDYGKSIINNLNTDDDKDIEDYLSNLAAELGITNSILFYERCYIIIEGLTEENSLPIFYHRLFDHSMIEDGIRLINIEGNGGRTGLLKLLGKNKQEFTIVFLDADTKSKKEFQESNLSKIYYIGEKEFEDSFSDDVICMCLNHYWPRIDGKPWSSDDLGKLRNSSTKKFSECLLKLIKQNTESVIRVNKPLYGKNLADICPKNSIPKPIIDLFDRARDIAKVT